MASYHLSIKSGKKGKAADHADYISREGRYGKGEKQYDLVAKEHGNLPDWANNNPATFWKAADKYERANGAAYREFELALPRELTVAQQQEMLNTFIQSVIGTKPYQFAIHAPVAALGDKGQPHAHAMCSDRLPDDIDRSPDLHFKRHNSSHPELGGCKKDSGGKPPEVLREELIAVRETWANIQNAYLIRHGHQARVDHRSHQDRGILHAPEKHLGHIGIKKMSGGDKALYKEQRQYRQASSTQTVNHAY